MACQSFTTGCIVASLRSPPSAPKIAVSNPIARLNESIEGRYRIEAELGHGGTATVYLAHDSKHDRKVAIKVLSPELARVLGTERFLNEIRITANLQHPHILPLFDSGEADSQLYYVMPFVAGETLKDRLEREQRLDIAESIAIGRSVAAALHYAHQQNVVHLDIKPENVMLSAGLPLVADFGIASALRSAQTDDEDEETLAAFGTPGYCSPEQAAGDPVDARSDVYSLGCLMYEMVTGERPYNAPNPRSLLVKMLTSPAPSARALREEVSERVDAAIRKALAKQPEDRFASPAEMSVAMTGAFTERVELREPLPLAAPARTPFVARGQERAVLLEALENAEQGQGSLLLISGEPGVGKTRLATEVLLEAQRRELFCFIGHAYEGQGTTPYGPFVETLDYAVRAVPRDVFRAALGDAAPEVARVMPKLREIFPDIPPPIELPVEQQRRYLFNSYREFVERGTQVAPLVLLLDDLQWADEPSLLLLEHLAQHLPTQRALLIGTYRDLQSEITPALERTLANLTRQRLARRITLGPLEQKSVGDLLVALGGENPPISLVSTIFRETEGNPFFVEEVFRDLDERGELFDADGAWRRDPSVEQLDVPEGVRLVVGRRLDRVGDDVRRVLTAGGVVGRGFGHDLIAALDLVSPEALIDALDAAEEAHLITSTSEGRGTRYRFSHELIRSTLVSRLSVPRRRQLHGRIARAMEAVYPKSLESRAADYSHHLYEAGSEVDTDTVRRFLDVAAGQALEGAAFEEALNHVDRALGLETVIAPRLHADLLSKKGEALRGLGDWAGTKASWDRALPMYEDLGEREIVASLCERLAEMAAWLGIIEEWRPLIVRGLDAIGEKPSVLRARLTAALGAIDARVGDLDSGLALFDEAIDMGTELNHTGVVSTAQAIATSAVCDHGSIYRTIELGESCVPALREEGLLWYCVDALSQVEYCRMTSGNVAECARLSADVRALGKELGHYGALLMDDMAMGHVQHMLPGELDRHVQWARNGLGAWAAVGGWAYFYALFLSVGLFWRGDWDAALEQIGVAIANFPGPWWVGRVHGWSLIMHAYTDPGRAREIFQENEGRIPAPGSTSWGGDKAFALVAPEALAVLGDRERAGALYPVAREVVEGGIVVWESGLGHRYLGISAACNGDWDTAEEHFALALTQARDIPFRSEQPEVRRWYAWMLMQRDAPGDRDRAQAMLGDAISLYNEIGMTRHAALAKASI